MFRAAHGPASVGPLSAHSMKPRMRSHAAPDPGLTTPQRSMRGTGMPHVRRDAGDLRPPPRRRAACAPRRHGPPARPTRRTSGGPPRGRTGDRRRSGSTARARRSGPRAGPCHRGCRVGRSPGSAASRAARPDGRSAARPRPAGSRAPGRGTPPRSRCGRGIRTGTRCRARGRCAPTSASDSAVAPSSCTCPMATPKNSESHGSIWTSVAIVRTVPAASDPPAGHEPLGDETVEGRRDRRAVERPRRARCWTSSSRPGSSRSAPARLSQTRPAPAFRRCTRPVVASKTAVSSTDARRWSWSR